MVKKCIYLILLSLLFQLTGCTTPENNSDDNKTLFKKTNESGFSTKQIDIKNKDVLDMITIGYSDRYIYFGDLINDVFEVRIYDIEKEILLDPLYSTKGISSISYTKIIDSHIYIGENYYTDNGVHFVLKRIDKDGNISVLMDEILIKMPYISEDNEDLLVNYSKVTESSNNTSYLESVNIKTSKREILDSRDCDYSEENGYTGEMIIYCGSMSSDGIYYQIISLSNESLEEGGTAYIYYYSKYDKSISKILTLEDKVLFVSGDKNYIITSNYSFNDATTKTGMIRKIEKDTKKEHEIPEVSPAFDILNSKKIDNDIFVFHTISNIYVYNTKTNTYYYEKYDTSSESVSSQERCSSLMFNENDFGYIKYSNSTKTATLIVWQ